MPAELRGNENQMVAFKTLIFTIFVPGTVAVWIPAILLSSPGARGSMNLDGFRYIGLSGILIGASIYLWCAWDFTFAGKGTPAPIDPPKRLVVRGLYNYVRNPMYVGVLTLILGQAGWFECLPVLEYATLAFLLMHAFVMLYEEPALARKFGETYAQYRETVPRWIPRLRTIN
jgi:protein-S-isoprenylcysteine O-methyltransferase Ste14